MSIHISKARKEYFICYKARLEDGSQKTITITSSKWKMNLVGKKYMKDIEDLVIEEDKKKRNLRKSRGSFITLNEVVREFNIDNYNRTKYGTAYGKELIMNKYIVPFFDGKLSLNDAFTIAHCRDFSTKVMSYDLSQNRKNKVFVATKELLLFACDRDYFSLDMENKLVKLMRPITSFKEIKEDKIKFWTIDEWKAFYNTFDDNDKFKMLFNVTYQAGLRFGELMALLWSDFNPEKRELSISKSMDGGGRVSTPKNVSSNNRVSISKQLAEELIEYKKQFGASDNDYMWFADGRTSRTTVRRIMNAHADLAHIHKLNFHGLRHSCASRLINAGVSPLLVSKHLRHSSVKETLDTYSHLFPSETEGVMDAVFSVSSEKSSK